MFNDIMLENNSLNVGFNSIKIESDFIEELKAYNKNSKINKEDYRNRIEKLYNDVGSIRPVDNEINNVIYFDEYNEIGLVLNKKNVSLKQVWTEYRLLYNEKLKDDDIIMDNSYVLDNFDEIFDKLSKRVDGVDKYIQELNFMRQEVKDDSLKLNYSKETLEQEKINFENYCKERTEMLEKKEKDLNEKIDRVNYLLSQLDEKMSNLIAD